MSADTNLTRKEIEELTTILNTKYSAALGDRFFDIDPKVDEEAVFLNVTLSNEKGSYVYPVQCRMKTQDESSRDCLLALLDYCDFYFEEFFQEDETIYLPIDWTDYEYEGRSFQLKGQIINQELEAKADQLLNSVE